MEYELVDNEKALQYEFQITDKIARVEYIKAQGKIYLTHTEVPITLEGKGIGSALVKAVLTEIKKNALILVPLCPFVALYLKRHPEWVKLVMVGN